MLAKIIDKDTIYVFDKSQFDWYAIRNCGQIFREPPCGIIEETDKIVIKANAGKDSGWLWNYFDLDTDYNEIKKELMQFEALHGPIKAGSGIRILRKPFEEAVILFKISATKKLKSFAKTIAQIDFEGLEKYSEDDFKRIGCGYRAPYLVKTIRQLKETDVAELSGLNNELLKKRLTALPGVGPKVFSCVALFCGDLRRLDIAPVDTWIHKATEQLGAKDAGAIFRHRYAGVAQQYIFYYLQHLRKQL